uniref:Uncharacterized protein n=1 Tax=Glossina pallidipes TaxID=7398 RepID=A0A1B0AAI1_GLOPL
MENEENKRQRARAYEAYLLDSNTYPHASPQLQLLGVTTPINFELPGPIRNIILAKTIKLTEYGPEMHDNAILHTIRKIEKPFYFTAGKGGGLLLANFRCSKVLSLAICLTVSNSLMNAAKTSFVPLQLAPFKSSKLSLRSKSAKMII